MHIINKYISHRGREMETIKKGKSGNYRTGKHIYKMKILLCGLNSRLYTAEEKFSELEVKAIETI